MTSRRVPGLVIAAVLALAPLAVPATAHAAARVTVTNEFGDAQADPRYVTELRLSGAGFQSIKNGHGGIYVFFGTVKGKWRPSQGGVTGEDYLYVPDAESKNNQGYQKFVAFPGSDTASAANGGTLNANGTWSTTIKVPGAIFQAVDRDGNAATVDCRKVTCGIITIGAHGVKNANNESFTPISFANIYDNPPADPSSDLNSDPTSDPTGQPSTASTQGATEVPATGTGDAPEAGAEDDAPGDAAPVATPVAAAIDPDTAVLGRVLTFSGTGFRPGEQVTVSFDNGRAAIGPLPAGPSGEVGGVLQLPPDIRPGTHTLRLIGAASGSRADITFPIRTDDTTTSSATGSSADPQDDSSSGLPGWAAWAFLAATLLLLAGVAVFAARRIRTLRARRSRHSRAATTGGQTVTRDQPVTSQQVTSDQEPAHAS